jgi:hypothetical protein
VQVIRQQGLAPDDLLVVDQPEVVQFYLGHAEFYYRVEGFERYTYPSADGVRSIYTDSLLLAERGDFRRLVETPHPGRRVWVISRGEHIERRAKAVDPRFWSALVRSADRRLEADDRTLIRAPLPLRG